MLRWLASYPNFATRYARAREAQADALFDEILQIADELELESSTDTSAEARRDNLAAVRRAQLRIDTRKWILSKLMPRKYGDRQRLDVSLDASLRSLSDEQLQASVESAAAELGFKLVPVTNA